jgi:hypothetical protein
VLQIEIQHAGDAILKYIRTRPSMSMLSAIKRVHVNALPNINARFGFEAALCYRMASC